MSQSIPLHDIYNSIICCITTEITAKFSFCTPMWSSIQLLGTDARSWRQLRHSSIHILCFFLGRYVPYSDTGFRCSSFSLQALQRRSVPAAMLRSLPQLSARSPVHYVVRSSHERARTIFIDLFSFRPRTTAQVCCYSLYSVTALVSVTLRRLASASTPKFLPLRSTVISSPYFHLRHY